MLKIVYLISCLLFIPFELKDSCFTGAEKMNMVGGKSEFCIFHPYPSRERAAKIK
jgi:hypothetical protein